LLYGLRWEGRCAHESILPFFCLRTSWATILDFTLKCSQVGRSRLQPNPYAWTASTAWILIAATPFRWSETRRIVTSCTKVTQGLRANLRILAGSESLCLRFR